MPNYYNQLTALEQDSSIVRSQRQRAADIARWLMGCPFKDGQWIWKQGVMKITTTEFLKVFTVTCYDKVVTMAVDTQKMGYWALAIRTVDEEVEEVGEADIFQPDFFQPVLHESGLILNIEQPETGYDFFFRKDSNCLGQTGFLDTFYYCLDQVKLLPLYLLK